MLISSLFSLLSRSASSRKLSILAFHKIPGSADPLVPDELCLDQFERTLVFLTRHFRMLPLSEAARSLSRGTLPSRAVAITFDDGYGDWHSGLTAVLQKHDAPATFFITTGQLQGEPLWHERIVAAVRALPDTGARIPEELIQLSDLSSITNRRRLVAALQDQLKYYDLETRTTAIEDLESQAVAPLTVAPAYSKEQLLELRRQGFEIGAHTVSHPILNKCSDKEARDELGRSREVLESVLKEPVRMFAYPNGRPNVDYGPEHVAMVRDAGYDLAVSTARGAASVTCDPLQLPRFSPWARSQWRMALQLSQNMAVNPPVVRTRSKRIFMVAFHFPPQSGSSGVLRTLNFVKHLPRHGWSPLVLSAHPRAYAERRDDLLDTIPTQTRVIRAFALDAARHFSLFRKYPRLLALPDRWSSWWYVGVLAGFRAIRQVRPDVLWSTYPIASAHLIAATLFRATGLPWVADFRDPMIGADHPSDPLQRKSWQWLESYVIRNASRCVFTTDRAAEVYRLRYPHAQHKMHVIENGYDEDAFVGVAAVRAGIADDVLLLLHSGVIYPKDRDPGPFFIAISRLISSGRLDPTRLCIRFRAPSHVQEIEVLARQHGLENVVDIAPSIPYRDALAEMLGADFLLVFQGSNFNAQVPAKIYEYLRAKRPLIALVDPTGDTALRLSEFASARLAGIEDADEIERVLEECFAARVAPALLQALETDAPRITRYSRSAQAQALSALLDTTARAVQ